MPRPTPICFPTPPKTKTSREKSSESSHLVVMFSPSTRVRRKQALRLWRGIQTRFHSTLVHQSNVHKRHLCPATPPFGSLHLRRRKHLEKSHPETKLSSGSKLIGNLNSFFREFPPSSMRSELSIGIMEIVTGRF